MPNCWTHCWKCNNEIKKQEDCNYFKTRSGDFNLCPTCFAGFIKHNEEYILPDKIEKQEIERSFNIAIANFHEYMQELSKQQRRVRNFSLSHSRGEWYDCTVCKKIIQFAQDSKLKTKK
jgi:hypothetical protein